MNPPGRGESALAAIAYAAVALVGLALAYAGGATYREIAVRESLHRQMFFAPAREETTTGVEGTTYGTDTLVRLHEGTLAYVLGVAPELPPSPTRGAFYTRAEAGHMADVRTVFTVAKAGALAGLVVLVALGVRRRRDPRGQVLLARSAALASAAGVAALAVFAAVAFEPFFLAFHEVFFPQGNFLFDPLTSNMLKLYPEEYWYGVTLRVGITFVVVAALVAALSHVASRRLAR